MGMVDEYNHSSFKARFHRVGIKLEPTPLILLEALHTIGHSSKRPSMNRNMVVVPASTTAKTTLRLPDLRAKNGLTGFAKYPGFRFLFHTLCTRDHILPIWPAIEAIGVGDIEGTVANKLSSSLKVGNGVVRALPKAMKYV